MPSGNWAPFAMLEPMKGQTGGFVEAQKRRSSFTSCALAATYTCATSMTTVQVVQVVQEKTVIQPLQIASSSTS